MKTVAIESKRSLTWDVTAVIGFSLLMAFAGQIRIPLFFSPVPLTLQTFVLFLSVIYLGRAAFFSTALYLFWGTTGLPIFTNAGAGFLYLLGPTGGYLMAMLIVSILLPRILPAKSGFLKSSVIFLSASMFILLSGAVWLANFSAVSLKTAFIMGAVPFMVGDTLKSIIVAAIKSRQ
jgi:biotin transport system substrate-specific component